MQRLIVKLALVLLLILIGLGASIIVPASAECRPPSDWRAYTVARGDTLYSIARRFNTTSATLAQGNCLYNPNYLLVGQVIRVPGNVNPPSGGTAPDFPAAASQIGSTYQAFENGFMIWRATTGGIWVFVWQGRNGGYVTQIPLNVYGGMSGDARYWQPIPAGRGLPVLGFKKVYDNFPDLRTGLGWAIGGEQGFLMAVQPEGQTFTISLPDQRVIRIDRNRGWVLANGTPPPPPPPPPTPISTGATFQRFQRGFMVWRADTGEIRVFFGTDTGTLVKYPASQYASLPDWPYVPPAGPPYQYPVQFGFGKVWGNIPGVRERLGWATGSERGYTMVIEETPSAASFTLPDGYSASNVGTSTWTVTGIPGSSGPLYGDITPTPTFTPTPHMDGVPQVNQFSASKEVVLPGETITLNWDVSGVENIGLTATYVADYRLFFDYTSERLPNVGSTILTIPDHTDVYDSDATLQLYWPVGDTPAQWQAIDGGLLTVHIGCPYAVFWNASLCAQAPVEELPAVYQPFEHGFMLQVNGTVYPVVFDDAHTAMLFVEPEPVELGTPPEGLFAPDAAFVDTWTSSPRYQEMLGWAVAQGASYISHTQTLHYRIRDEATAHQNYVTMPDSRVLVLKGSVLGGPAIRWDWAE